MTDIYLITLEPERYPYWDKFEDCQTALANLDFQGELSVDTETTGLNSCHIEKLHCIQIGIPGKAYIFDSTIPFSVLKKPLETKLLILQNAGYDIPFLNVQNIFPIKIWDTLTAEHCLTRGILYPKGHRGLDAMVERYCGVKIDKSRQKTIAGGLGSREDIEYAGTDVIYLPQIRDSQIETANRRGMLKHIEIKNAFVLFLSYMEYCGMPIDQEALYDYIREAEAEEWAMLKKLKEYRDINWRSSKQVGEILKELGIEEVNDDTGNLLTGVDVLQKHEHIPVIKDLLEFRALTKKVTSYGRKWFHYIIDGKIHTRYRQTTDTGRTNCGATDRKKFDPWDVNYHCSAPFPNMQQIPADFRSLFRTPKGWTFVVADYSGQETVILADQSEEPNMLRLLREGRDLHCFAARLIFPETAHLDDEKLSTLHKDKRQASKAGGFAIAYGGNGSTIAANLNIPVEQGDKVYEGYLKAFPGLKPFFKHCYEYTGNHGYIPLDKFGGKRFFNRGKEFIQKFRDKVYWNRYYDEKRLNSAWYRGERETMGWFHGLAKTLRKDAVNSRIQGTGGTMSIIACNYLYQYIHANKLFDKVKAGVFVHDEIGIWCVDKLSKKMAEVLENCMKKAGEECLNNLKINAAAKIATIWPK
jgi:DNA polymerase I-like protein with 3'-5' exonuclease and polymerase domains